MSRNFAQQRQEMLQQHLSERGITDPRVLHAMEQVPREDFISSNLAERAYEDRALPIEHEQTISQPYTVGFMCQALMLTGHEKVLEIGTGSGYGAAVLSRLAREVHTVERIPQLAESARFKLQNSGYRNVAVHLGDGTLGWPDAAPYDAIIVTAGGTELPDTYGPQLRPGGRILIPLGEERSRQTMYRYTRTGQCLQRESLGLFAFVPLIGEFGQPEEA